MPEKMDVELAAGQIFYRLQRRIFMPCISASIHRKLLQLFNSSILIQGLAKVKTLSLTAKIIGFLSCNAKNNSFLKSEENLQLWKKSHLVSLPRSSRCISRHKINSAVWFDMQNRVGCQRYPWIFNLLQIHEIFCRLFCLRFVFTRVCQHSSWAE